MKGISSKRRIIKSVLSAAVLGLATMGAVSATAAEVTLRAASFIPLDATFGKPFQMFINRVNETGKGLIQIRASGPEAISGMEQPNALRSGLLDMVATPPSMYKAQVPETHLQDLSTRSLAGLRESGAFDAMNKILAKKLNAQTLTLYGNEVPFYLYLREDKVKSLQDMHNLRIRSQPVYGPFLKALNVSQTMVPIPETYTALDRGIVDGIGYPGWGLGDMGWDKMLKVRLEPGFYSVTVNIMMNDKKLASLTPEQRKVLDDAVKWFEAEMIQYNIDTSKANLEAQKAAGIVAVDLGPEYLAIARDALWKDMEKNSTEDLTALRPLFIE